MNICLRFLLCIIPMLTACTSRPTPTDSQRAPASKPTSVVVSYHPLATEIGERILAKGGNAFDAFVAVTAAQYVLSEGVTSIAGPLGALLYERASGKVIYLDATFNSPVDPAGKFDPKQPVPGKTARVPGAPAGLEAISKRFGKLSFAQALQPAIALARDGFPVSELLIREKDFAKDVLRRSNYGSSTYLPLKKDDILKQPTTAQTLENLANYGAAYMYTGEWAKHAVKSIQEHGGKLTEEDFSAYKSQWLEPLKINYRGYDIYAPSGRTYSGHSALLALKALERSPFDPAKGHYSQNADMLEIVARIEKEAEAKSNFYAFLNDAAKLDDRAALQAAFESDAQEVWNNAEKKLQTASAAETGTHSYHVVIVDSDGNAITGTNTIESLPWGEGIFVDGIALSAGGSLRAFENVQSGTRDVTPFSMEIGFRGSKLVFASGAFSSSLAPASFQFMVNIIDYKFSGREVTTRPRFGITAYDIKTHQPTGRGLWLDKRVAPDIVQTLAKRNLLFDQQSVVDTGLGSVAIIGDDGSASGSIVPLPGVKTPGFD